MRPGRPLLILFLAIIPFFSIPYSIVLKRPPKRDGIWKVWISERVRKDLGSEEPVRLNLEFFSALGFGFYFSLISAFSIGWRELNVGNWITRIQWREYTLRASGWVRMVSGAQSLVSVYLLALWVLTYFGRPFEAVWKNRISAMYPHRQQNCKTCVFGYQVNQNNEKKLVHLIWNPAFGFLWNSCLKVHSIFYFSKHLWKSPEKMGGFETTSVINPR